MLAGLFARIPRHTFPQGCAILLCAGLTLDCIPVSLRKSILIADFNGIPWQGSLADAVAVVLPTLGEIFGRRACVLLLLLLPLLLPLLLLLLESSAFCC